MHLHSRCSFDMVWLWFHFPGLKKTWQHLSMWSITEVLVNGEDLRICTNLYTTCTIALISYRGLIQDWVSRSVRYMSIRRASSALWLVILPNLCWSTRTSIRHFLCLLQGWMHPKDSDGGAILLPCSSCRHAISTSDMHAFAARWTAKEYSWSIIWDYLDTGRSTPGLSQWRIRFSS